MYVSQNMFAYNKRNFLCNYDKCSCLNFASQKSKYFFQGMVDSCAPEIIQMLTLVYIVTSTELQHLSLFNMYSVTIFFALIVCQNVA